MFKEKRLIYHEKPESGVEASPSSQPKVEDVRVEDYKNQADAFLDQVDTFKAEAKANLIERIQSKTESARRVMRDFENIKGLSHEEIAMTFIEAGYGNLVVKMLGDLEVSHQKIAEALFKTDQGGQALRHADKFDQLTPAQIKAMAAKAEVRRQTEIKRKVDRNDAAYAKERGF